MGPVRARASHGATHDLGEVDLPGSLAGIEIHEGPPTGLTGARVAIIKNHATRTWAVTAAIVHPGTGMRDADDRARMGRGLADLLDQASRTELVDEVLFLVRTVPEDGAERDQWIARHRRPDGLERVRAINDELQQVLTGASVRTEAYVSIVVPETRLGKAAKESGRGIEGRAQVLYTLMAEIEAQLRAGMGCSSVSWLTSPELAIACRTGFAPGDRAGIVDALTAKIRDPQVNADVPWAMAGPSGADRGSPALQPRRVELDQRPIQLPIKGALLGALAPVLVPTGPGERRSYPGGLPDPVPQQGCPAVRHGRPRCRHGPSAAEAWGQAEHQGQGRER